MRTCIDCGAELFRCRGSGRWPLRCEQCKYKVVRTGKNDCDRRRRAVKRYPPTGRLGATSTSDWLRRLPKGSVYRIVCLERSGLTLHEIAQKTGLPILSIQALYAATPPEKRMDREKFDEKFLSIDPKQVLDRLDRLVVGNPKRSQYHAQRRGARRQSCKP